MKEKKLIGLTGKYCAGKNFISSLLEKRGFPVLDVDVLGHQVMEKEREAIIEHFGNDILDANGKINRKLLGKKVFGKPEELSLLESIIHPAANRETIAWIDERKDTCIINAALLHRSSVFDKLDGIIIVKAPLLCRILRAKKRDKLPWIAIFKRINSQKNFYPQYFSRKTDIQTIENSVFHRKVEDRLDKIISLLGI